VSLELQFNKQSLGNGYQFVDGVRMHREQGDRFQIPPDVLKQQVAVGHFVEVRIDSPRFSVHPDAPEKCTCASCNGEATKPILSHQQPASLMPLPDQSVPSRGWGEDFWMQVTERDGDWLIGRVDNPLYESRLHGLSLDSIAVFHANHILAVHPGHRMELVSSMNEDEVRELIAWLQQQQHRDS
jgi:hypothetical protein